MARFSSAFHSHPRQYLAGYCTDTKQSLDCCYIFIFSARIVKRLHCLDLPENTCYSIAELCFCRISAFHVTIHGIKTVDFVIVNGFSSSSSSNPNIPYFTEYD